MKKYIRNRRPFTAISGLILFAALFIGSTGSAPAAEQPESVAPEASSDQSAVAGPETAVSEVNVPKGKRTELGLYLTAREAYEVWESDPEAVTIIDVRTREEYLFVGHPAMAWKIPLAEQSYEWDAAKGHYPMKFLPDFVSRVRTIAESDETIFVMCRSGGRSAKAVNMLTEAGFTQVYNIIDGMEGDKVGDPVSVYKGQRLVNGWKNSGCPWTYKLTPEQMVLPEGKE